MLRRLITATALAVVPLLGVTVPATAATTAPGARMQVHTAPPPCAAGYAVWYITDQFGNNFYLDAEGIGNKVQVTSTPTCWHAPASGFGYFEDNSGNCLDWDHSIGYVIMEPCEGLTSEYWEPTQPMVGIMFTNEYAVGSEDHFLNAALGDGDYVGLGPVENANTTWYR
jgi:hypothetical protein